MGQMGGLLDLGSPWRPRGRLEYQQRRVGAVRMEEGLEGSNYHQLMTCGWIQRGVRERRERFYGRLLDSLYRMRRGRLEPEVRRREGLKSVVWREFWTGVMIHSGSTAVPVDFAFGPCRQARPRLMAVWASAALDVELKVL